MKKLFFIMAMSVCAFTAQAQTTSGIRVGLNMTSVTGKYNDLMADQDYNNKNSQTDQNKINENRRREIKKLEKEQII